MTQGWETQFADPETSSTWPEGDPPHRIERFEAPTSRGDVVGISVHHFASDLPGPRVVILGGTHGDEVTGILAAGTLARRGLRLRSGRVDIVPTAHEAAASVASRTSPSDDGNLARTFPGRADGEPTEVVAHLLTTHVLSGADLLIDLHTAGRVSDMPFLVGHAAPRPDDPVDRRACAKAFGAPFVWEHPEIAPGRTLSVVEDGGGVGLYTESAGGERLRPAMVAAYVTGVYRVLAHLGMIQPVAPADTGTPIRLHGDGDVDEAGLDTVAAGYFMPAVDAGDTVAAGDVLGVLVDATGVIVQTIASPSTGAVALIRTAAHIGSGERVAVVTALDSGVHS